MNHSSEDQLNNPADFLLWNEGPPSEPDYEHEIKAVHPKLSFVLTLVFCLSIAWVLKQWRIFNQIETVNTNHVLAMRIDLNLYSPPTFDPEVRSSPGPAGGSNKKGTGSIDPSLLSQNAVKVIFRPPEFLPEVPLVDKANSIRDLDSTLLPASYPLDKSLPVQPGGNGAYKGDGKGFGRGHGDGVGGGLGGGGSNALTLLKSVQPDFKHIGKAGPREGELVKVELMINALGVPERAVPLSGRPILYPVVLQAALGWRFRVPPEYGHLAPFHVVIEFVYHRGPKSSRSVEELSPVILK